MDEPVKSTLESICFLMVNGLSCIHYVGAFLIGSCVGFAELLQRYKSEKVKDIVTRISGLIYILINGFASLLALVLIAYYNPDLGLTSSAPVSLMLIAGGSSMLVLRSSFFTLKGANNKDYSVGLGVIVNILIERADRAFDQDQAIRRAPEIQKIMEHKDYMKASNNLTQRCLALMSLAPEEVKELENQIRELTSMPTDNETKSFALGCLLVAYTGPELLEKAVTTLGTSIDSPSTSVDSETSSKINERLLAKFRGDAKKSGGGNE